jgi:hypothetical protein
LKRLSIWKALLLREAQPEKESPMDKVTDHAQEGTGEALKGVVREQNCHTQIEVSPPRPRYTGGMDELRMSTQERIWMEALGPEAVWPEALRVSKTIVNSRR